MIRSERHKPPKNQTVPDDSPLPQTMVKLVHPGFRRQAAFGWAFGWIDAYGSSPPALGTKKAASCDAAFLSGTE
jgi:hypothetical protein